MNPTPKRLASLCQAGLYVMTIVCFLIAIGLPFFSVVSAQRKPSRKPQPARVARKQPIDYSKFSHATPKHRAACNSCHKAPTQNWRDVRAFPDIADYPSHDACVACHRRQFFIGARPPICTICHVNVSPHDDKRLAFRNPPGPRQFTIEFPHDRHQDVIALFERFIRNKRSQFVRAMFTHSSGVVQQKYNFYNCEICHASSTKTPAAPAAGWIDNYVPPVDTFKASPDSHAACFNCHWSAKAPTSQSCDGCHRLANAPYPASAVPERKSMKFRHDGGGDRRSHAVPPTECTVCHINITKAATVVGLKPDVPITACTECHNKDGLRQDLNQELAAIDKDRSFVCIYCHTSDVGHRDPPASHYLIAEREPLKPRVQR